MNDTERIEIDPQIMKLEFAYLSNDPTNLLDRPADAAISLSAECVYNFLWKQAEDTVFRCKLSGVHMIERQFVTVHAQFAVCRMLVRAILHFEVHRGELTEPNKEAALITLRNQIGSNWN
jgi:hypothetical protein